MATTKTSLFDGALRVIAQAKLVDLADPIENRRLLDDVFDSGAQKYALSRGNWNFATRTIKVETDSDTTPSFGFPNAFSKPTDWVRTVALTSDEFFRAPLTDFQFSDENDFWFSNLDQIYVRYISDDASFGLDLARWPQAFALYFEAHLASQIVARATQDIDVRAAIDDKTTRLLIDAQSQDALNEGTKFHPPGSWALSRRGRGIRSDRGVRGRLIG